LLDCGSYLLAVQIVTTQATAMLEPCLAPKRSKKDLPRSCTCGKGRFV
jgi:hypothetical protein